MPQREKLGHIYQKEDKLQDELQKEATVLGVSPLIIRETLGKYCKCVWEIFFFFFFCLTPGYLRHERALYRKTIRSSDLSVN